MFSYLQLRGGGTPGLVGESGCGRCVTSWPYTEALLSAVPIPDPSVRRKRIVLRGGRAESGPSAAGLPLPPVLPARAGALQDRAPEPPLLREHAPGRSAACHFPD